MPLGGRAKLKGGRKGLDDLRSKASGKAGNHWASCPEADQDRNVQNGDERQNRRDENAFSNVAHSKIPGTLTFFRREADITEASGCEKAPKKG